MEDTPAQTRGQYRWCLLGIGFSVFLFTLDLSIVNVALPTLVKVLNTDFATIQWVVLSYLVVVAALLPGAARLGDLYDKRKLYMTGLAVFTAGSVLCGLSPNVEVLIAARALQGLGATFVSALGLAIVTEIAPSEERGKAIGTVGGLISIGVATGPTLAGIILKLATWRWIFLVNLPLGLLCWFVLKRHLPSLPGRSESTTMDYPGLGLLSLALIAVELGFNRFQRAGLLDRPALALVGVAIVTAVAFVLWERRHPEPLVSFELFQHTQFSLGLALALIVFIVLAGSLFLMPFFLETALGYETFQVGLMMAVAPVAAGLVSPLAGTTADRVGERAVSIVGLLLLAAGCFAISRFHQQMSDLRFVGSYLLFGLGVGTFQAPNNSVIMGSAPKRRAGTASGLLSLSRTLGQSLGIAIMASSFLLVAAHGKALGGEIDSLSASQMVHGLRVTFGGAGVCLLVGVVVSFLKSR